jgi:CubicO group peptidase (beta-lactamase class C family)
MKKRPKLRAGTAEEAGILPDRVARAKDIAADAVKKGLTPSLAVLAARRGVIPLHEAFGQLRPGPDAPPLPRDAIFPITSATKPITATLIMILVEDGRVGLSRPILDYLPELEGEGLELVLVHHLLTHTSGYDDMVIFPTLVQARESHPDLDWSDGNAVEAMMFETCRAVPRTKAPGEFARERLFGPLGMKDTDYILRDDMRERVLQRPMEAPLSENLIIFPGIESDYWRTSSNGGAAVYSTAMDLAIFGQMILNGGSYGNERILSPVTVAEMTRNQIPGVPAILGQRTVAEGSYGYGWIVAADERWRYFSASIRTPGAFVHSGAGGINLHLDPAYDMVTVYMEVTMKISENLEPISWSFDHVHSALLSGIDE